MRVTVLIVVVFATVACGSIVPIIPGVTYLQPAPQFNRAIVQSEQHGGKFAYSIHEGQTYQAISPQIQQVPIKLFWVGI